MKKSLLLILSFLVVLSACNSSKNAVVMKRKYTKGYYVDAKTKKHNTKKAEIVVASEKPDVLKAKPVSVELVSQTPEVATELNVTASATAKKDVATVTKESTKKARRAEQDFKSNVVAKTLFNVFEKNTLLAKATVKKKDASSSRKGDADLIVQIILALFPILCLIAVYLHDGKSITMNFWVTLLLHLLVYAECIFAILVVLDLVNLA